MTWAVSFLILYSLGSGCFFYLYGISFLCLSKFSCMILLKIWHIPLTWDSFLSYFAYYLKTWSFDGVPHLLHVPFLCLV